MIFWDTERNREGVCTFRGVKDLLFCFYFIYLFHVIYESYLYTKKNERFCSVNNVRRISAFLEKYNEHVAERAAIGRF